MENGKGPVFRKEKEPVDNMEMDELFNKLNALVKEKKYRELKAELIEMNEVDIANFMEDLNSEQTVVVFRMLPKELATDVFAALPVENQQQIITSITDNELSVIVNDLYVDDAVDMLEELPANVVKRVLKNSSPDTRKLINQFLNYPDDSAGSVMTAEYIGLRKTMTVRDAFEYIRENGVDKETIYTCYVTDDTRRLEGVITVKDLLMNPYETVIGDIMDDNVIKVTTTEDQENVAMIFNDYDLLSLPVVDNEDRLVGIITVDDVMDVMEEEATEDIQKMAAIIPSEKPYLKTDVLTLARNRIPWLLVLMFSSLFTGAILLKYENAFAAVPLLVTFVPMLMDTGGNSGSQASTMIIRGMAVGDIELPDAAKVLWKEIRVGMICGFILASANFVRLMIQYPGHTMISFVVVLSVFCTVIIAKSIGSMLPMLAKAIHLDPALVASPMLTTVVDAASLMIYFTFASRILGLMNN